MVGRMQLDFPGFETEDVDLVPVMSMQSSRTKTSGPRAGQVSPHHMPDEHETVVGEEGKDFSPGCPCGDSVDGGSAAGNPATGCSCASAADDEAASCWTGPQTSSPARSGQVGIALSRWRFLGTRPLSLPWPRSRRRGADGGSLQGWLSGAPAWVNCAAKEGGATNLGKASAAGRWGGLPAPAT